MNWKTRVRPESVTASSPFAGLLQDVRYAARLARRQPRHTLLTIGMTALGIGATTALFSVAYGVLWKPLPWPHADRVVVLKETRGGNPPRFGAFTNAAYLAWREQPATIESIAAWSQRVVTLSGAAARAHPHHRGNPFAVPGTGNASAHRQSLRGAGRILAGGPALGEPVAAAIRRRPRRHRENRAARWTALYDCGRPSGRDVLPRSPGTRHRPVCGSSRLRQYAVRVQRDRGASVPASARHKRQPKGRRAAGSPQIPA